VLVPDADSQRAFALEVAQQLRAAGFEALWAGGCVRDELLGLTPKDYDVATNAKPDEIRNLFGRRRTLMIGAAFGVVTVLGPRAAGQIEVATFRTDAAYSDGRHPDSISFTNAEHDAQRRDFTINGLFFDPLTNEVVDYVGGQDDLKRRTIRAIGDPHQRLGEDKLRMLRAVRFAATYEFEIESTTLQSIQQMAADIHTVSAERIGVEIRRMLLHPTRAIAIVLLRNTNLLAQVLPEVNDLPPNDFAETTRTLAELQAPPLSLALAALLLKLPTPNSQFPTTNLPTPHSLLPTSIGRRLRYTNKEIERATWLLAALPDIARAAELPWPRLQRLLTHEGTAELIALRRAAAGSDDAPTAFCQERMAWPSERLNPPPLIDGSALIHHGLRPGPHFSDLLEQARDAQLNGEIHTREEALALIDRLRGQPETLP
jgi:tRNA nucleotidyltransferase/poly(A) polymerase